MLDFDANEWDFESSAMENNAANIFMDTESNDLGVGKNGLVGWWFSVRLARAERGRRISTSWQRWQIVGRRFRWGKSIFAEKCISQQNETPTVRQRGKFFDYPNVAEIQKCRWILFEVKKCDVCANRFIFIFCETERRESTTWTTIRREAASDRSSCSQWVLVICCWSWWTRIVRTQRSLHSR